MKTKFCIYTFYTLSTPKEERVSWDVLGVTGGNVACFYHGMFDTKESVIQCVKRMAEVQLTLGKWQRKNIDDFLCREIDVFFSDGYDNPSNRTALFCVKGSPNKFMGYIRRSGDAYAARTNWGVFAYTERHFKLKVSKWDWRRAKPTFWV